MRPSLLIAAIAAACASQTVAKGINCEGSGWCTSAGTGVAAALTDLIMTIDDHRWYSNGEHIACTQSKAYLGAPDAEGDIGYCAFLQNTGGTWGSQIKVLAPYIAVHKG